MAPMAAAVPASAASSPISRAPWMAPSIRPLAAAPTSPDNCAVALMTSSEVWPIVSRLATPAFLVPRTTPTTRPLVAWLRSPPTSETAWIVPWATCDVTSTTDVLMPPTPWTVLATVLLTTSTIASETSSVPLKASTMPLFTDSMRPKLRFSIGHLQSAGSRRDDCAAVSESIDDWYRFESDSVQAGCPDRAAELEFGHDDKISLT